MMICSNLSSNTRAAHQGHIRAASASLLSSQVCWWQDTTNFFMRMDNSAEIRCDSRKLLHTS